MQHMQPFSMTTTSRARRWDTSRGLPAPCSRCGSHMTLPMRRGNGLGALPGKVPGRGGGNGWRSGERAVLPSRSDMGAPGLDSRGVTAAASWMPTQRLPGTSAEPLGTGNRRSTEGSPGARSPGRSGRPGICSDASARMLPSPILARTSMCKVSRTGPPQTRRPRQKRRGGTKVRPTPGLERLLRSAATHLPRIPRQQSAATTFCPSHWARSGSCPARTLKRMRVLRSWGLAATSPGLASTRAGRVRAVWCCHRTYLGWLRPDLGGFAKTWDGCDQGWASLCRWCSGSSGDWGQGWRILELRQRNFDDFDLQTKRL